MHIRSWIIRIDLILLSLALLISGLGLIILRAITIKPDLVGLEFDPNRQLLFLVIGLIAMFLLLLVDSRQLRRFSWAIYLSSLALLAAVLAFGVNVGGATRWIELGWFQFQPSEISKLALIIITAALLARWQQKVSGIWTLVVSAGLLALLAVMIALEPDLGTAISLVFIWGAMIASSSIPKWILLALGVLVLAVLPIAYNNLQPYQQQRVQTFLDPGADPQGAGYNSTQAAIAVGSGGWFGQGLESGTQSQLNFLPAQHTDFIFAVTAEKLGFAGAMLLITLYLLLFLRLILIAWRANDTFSFQVTLGVLAMLVFHVAVNIGMNLQLLPVTGLPLPFMSFGGTSLITFILAIGLVMAVQLRDRDLHFVR